MEPVVHENAAAAKRLADLDLTAADLISALIGADQEARTWTPLAPQMMAGLARWGRTNELLRARRKAGLLPASRGLAVRHPALLRRRG